MESKKGQAAMEFLMTYGWAILVAIIAIGVLAYYGVFNPGRFISDSCIMNNPLGCEEFTIAPGTITLVIRNGAGVSIDISSIAIDDCTNFTTPTTIVDGDKTAALGITCTGLAAEEKVRKDIKVTYIKSGGTLTLTTSGTISGRVP